MGVVFDTFRRVSSARGTFYRLRRCAGEQLTTAARWSTVCVMSDTTNSGPLRIEIRCTAEEREKIRARAAADGYLGRGFATWARETLLGKEPSIRRPPSKVVLMSVAAVAEQCGVSRQQVYTWINQGKLPHYDMPEGTRIASSDVDKL